MLELYSAKMGALTVEKLISPPTAYGTDCAKTIFKPLFEQKLM
ncbi:MAG: hypothetical protein ACJA13_003000 [Paraglaciecola sp.]|jgi:hypothetical protein